MRVKHTLWRVSNGWLLVPEDQTGSGISAAEAPQCAVFKSLDEFAKFTPKRERKKRTNKYGLKPSPTKPQPEKTPNADKH